MDNRTNTKIFLEKWVNREVSPRFAVLIEGAWGAGKTHFIQSVIKDESFTERKKVYLSVFGINSLEALETQLFFESASGTRRAMHHGARFVGSMLKASLRIDVNGDGQSDGSISSGMEGLDKFVRNASRALDESFVVFDDLERCQIPMPELMGFVNQLVEHSDTRVLLIANSEKLEGEQKNAFDNFKEKIIGQSFQLSANSLNALSEFLEEIEDRNVAKVLEESSSQIQELFEQSGYNNLRALRQFVWSLSALLVETDRKFLQNKYLLENLIQQYFVFYTEFKLDLGRLSLTPHDLVSGINREDDWIVYEFVPEEDQPPKPKYVAISKYASTGFDTVMPVSLWIECFQTGLVNRERLNTSLSESKYAKELSVPAWRRLWYYRNNEDEALDKASIELSAQFDNRSEEDIGSMLHMFALRFLLAFFDGNTDHYSMIETDCKQYINDLVAQNRLKSSPVDWRKNMFPNMGFYGCGLAIRKEFEPHFTRVWDYLIAVQKNVFEAQAPCRTAEVLDALKTDVDEFRNLVASYSSGNYQNLPVLKDIPPTDFVEAWLSTLKVSWENILFAFDARYERGKLQEGQPLHDEKEWVLDVGKEMKKRAESEAGFKKGRILIHIPSVCKALMELDEV